MCKTCISLVFHGQFDRDFIEKIILAIESVFRLQVQFTDGHIDMSVFFNPSRRQYNANALLQIFESETWNKSLKTVGLFQVDLFIPILTYIFGQAFLKGNVAITSVFRLRNEQYGLNENKSLLLERAQKVIIHELGHTFGLVHCHIASCVMQPASYVEEIDQKNCNFCSRCKNQLEKQIRDFCHQSKTVQ